HQRSFDVLQICVHLIIKFLPLPDAGLASCSVVFLHDALPISCAAVSSDASRVLGRGASVSRISFWIAASPAARSCKRSNGSVPRSEEHTSELQSRVDLVCRLLPEKKKHSGFHTAKAIVQRGTV